MLKHKLNHSRPHKVYSIVQKHNTQANTKLRNLILYSRNPILKKGKTIVDLYPNSTIRFHNGNVHRKMANLFSNQKIKGI